MSHSSFCLWKRQYLSQKLKREVTLEEVHQLCDELGFTDHQATIEWIVRASPEEIEAVLARRKRRKRLLYGSEAEAYEYAYVG